MKKPLMFTMFLVLSLALASFSVSAEVCVAETGICYGNVDACAGNATSGQTCTITDGSTYTVASVVPTVALTFNTNSTSGQPTVTGTSVSNPVFDLATSGTGVYVIDGLRITHADGMGVAVDGTVTQVTIINNDFFINASTGNNWGDGGANGVWMAQGDNHIIQGNSITLNGGICCNYGVHVDGSWNNLALENILIDNNTMFIYGQGGFDGGINTYQDTLRETDVVITNNIITVNTTGLDDAGFGSFVDGALTYQYADNVFDITGQKGGVGLWFDATSVGSNYTVFRDHITVRSINSTFASHPIVSTATENLRLHDVTLINEEGDAGVLTTASTSFCRTSPVINMTNPTWNGNISFLDNSGWYSPTTISCGEAHVSYDVTVQTGVSGASVVLNSTSPNALNPTNTVIGVADGGGDYVTSLGAFYANNETYLTLPYLSFNPYNVVASATGYVDNSTSAIIASSDTIVLLTLSLEPVVPPVEPAEPEVPLTGALRLVLGLALLLILLGAVGVIGVKKK